MIKTLIKKINKWWENNYEEVFNFNFILLVVLLVLFLFISFTYNRRSNSANFEIATLRNELSDAREEIIRAGSTIEAVRTVQQELTNGIRESNGELRSVIERLEFIRDEVQVLESVIDSYYSNNGSNNYNNNNINNGGK